MKLRALRLYNVKRFAGRGVAIENIGDGVNVLTAANEFGKSTSFEALHALFFQPHSGTPNSVKLLKPYSGGSPLVEVDLETDEGAFRISKQFYAGRHARVTDLRHNRLVAQADEAEAFIADLTRGGAGGPAGLLWVRQGLTGIEKRSSSEEESDRRVRETLLSSVQGEVEALTGGRRMNEILAECEAALDRLVTPGTMKPRKGGPYLEAIEERDRLATQEAELAADVTTLHEALERRRQAMRRLAELEAPAETEAREAKIRLAEEAYQSARSHSETLRAAQAGLALASEQHRAAVTRLDQLEAANERAGRVERQMEQAIQRRDTATARHAGARAESDCLQAAQDAAEGAERLARADKNRLDAAQAALDAAMRFEASTDLLSKAEALRSRVEAGEAVLASLQVPDVVLKQIESLDVDLARLRAVQSVTLPRLRMEYADPAAQSLALDGVPLANATEQSFSGTVELVIADLGRLTIQSQHVDDAAEGIAVLEDKIRRLLLSIGADSLAAARQRQNAAREQANGLTLDKQMLAQLAPDGIEKLRETVARLDSQRGDGLETKFDAAAIIEALQKAEAEVESSRIAVREARPVTEAAYTELLTAHAALAQLEAEMQALNDLLGANEDRPIRRRQALDEVAACRRQVEAAEAELAPLLAQAEDLEVAELSLKRLRAVAAAAAQEIMQNRQVVSELNGAIRTQAGAAVEEVWQETKDLLATATDRARRYETEVKTLDRLRRALTTARSSARDLYLKPVISELRPLIGLLFDDVSVAFNEATLLPETLLRNGQEEAVDRLSGGMREQLSILTRLAFARLLARDGRPAPVILDDALVYSDDERIERMFEALHRQSRDQQILVFSCRQRAFSGLGGNVLSMSAWSPG